MKVLITGSNGQLGKALLKLKPKGIEVIPTNRSNFNLENIDQCKEFIVNQNPDWVINAGAYTAVDLAEDEPRKAMLVNGEAPKEIAKTLKELGGNLIHISTDFVFDGSQSFPYQPDQTPRPISVYGETKLAGEEGIKQVLGDDNNYLILRTSWVIGPVGKNFLITMLKLHNSKDTISVVCDQIGCITSTNSLSIIIWEIVQKNLIRKKISHKILHWSQAGVSSWFDIANEIGDLGTQLNLIPKKSKVIPIPSTHYVTKAKRPRFSLLDSTLTKELLKIENDYWRYSLLEILQEIKLKNLFNVS